MMDPVVIEALGGGPMAVLVAILLTGFGGLLLAVRALWTQVNKLNDKLVDMAGQGSRETREMHAKTLEGMAALTSATQTSNATSQAALAALERRQ